MRKAFDANIPKLKPRLKSAVESDGAAVADPGPQASGLGAPAEAPSRDIDEVVASARPEWSGREAAAESIGEPAASPARPEPVEGRQDDVRTRHDRLEKIKRRVAAAAKPAARIDPVPSDPARAAESVLGLVRDLESELSHAREREEALRADLDGARGELSRVAAEARVASERLGTAEKELEEKRSVLAELLAEMETLEEERDQAVRRAQALSALDEERARLLDEVTRRADEEARLRAEREAEVERLGEELRAGATDGARLRAAVGELARERDGLATELDRLRAERDELGAAKRALEQVHAALAQARARLG
jgi:chromosome segregation ATPase